MKTPLIPLLFASLSLLVPILRADEPPIDLQKAHGYFDRRQRGEKLTGDEEAYIRRAMAEQQRQNATGTGGPPATSGEGIDWERARQLHAKAQRGEKLTAEEQAYYDRARASRGSGDGGGGVRPPAPAPWTQHLTPLTELGTAKYKGEDGGLYGGGMNEPPKAHLEAAMREAAKIRPLDADGKESAGGKIGLLSIGMSNTTMEYSKFKQLADADPAKSKGVVIVDGAQGGQTAMRWADPKAPLWQKVDERLTAAGLSARQVQAVWMKQAEAGPAQYGDFPKHAKQLQENLVKDLANLKEKFPNLRIVYLSSRIYGGYALTGLNPEPYAYEEAFSMRWLIQDQIAGKPELNYDATKGAVKSPLLLWGPYLWADGETPRKADGLVYKREDLTDKDGTHPTDSARQKVAELLLKFFKTDPTAKTWFGGEPQKASSR